MLQTFKNAKIGVGQQQPNSHIDIRSPLPFQIFAISLLDEQIKKEIQKEFDTELFGQYEEKRRKIIYGRKRLCVGINYIELKILY